MIYKGKTNFHWIRLNRLTSSLSEPWCWRLVNSCVKNSVRLAPKVIFLRKSQVKSTKSQVMTLTFLWILKKVKNMTLNFFEKLLENTFWRFLLVPKGHLVNILHFWHLDSLDPFLNQNNEKKIEKIVKKVRKSNQSKSHDFDLTWLD